MYVFSNLNPRGLHIGDCVVRAISEALGQTWEKTYVELCVEGYEHANLPNANEVWASYLQQKGFKRYGLPNTCPVCYTVGDFAAEHSQGTYIVATGTHVVCVKDGVILDTWDSSNETAAYYFSRG